MSCILTAIKGGERIEIPAQTGESIADALRRSGLPAVFPCGGRGVCGQCRVLASGGLSPIDEREAALLRGAPEGTRLACMALLTGDAQAILPDSDIEILSQGATADFVREPMYKSCGAAVDIGTTTLAAQLWRGDTLIASGSGLNPQASFGSDVISRIEAALRGELPQLQSAVSGAIGELLDSLCRSTGAFPEVMTVTGNTTMLHLFAGEDPEPLSHAPFEAKRLFGEWTSGRECALPPPFDATPVYLAPCFSAFVGGDIATAVLASGMLKSSEPSLLVDIGTNGEMALLHGGRLLCCSTAAGPVFEGAQISCGMQGRAGAIDTVRVQGSDLVCTTIGGAEAVGICGSGLIDATAALLSTGALDETGALETDEITLAPRVRLTGQDIRMVQLAKGAIRAGMETLCDTAGIKIDEICTLYIAGGFGSKLNVRSAAEIGMIPPVLVDKAKVIGNAALSGASMLLRAAPLTQYCREFISAAETVELSSNPRFADNYMEYMMF